MYVEDRAGKARGSRVGAEDMYGGVSMGSIDRH